MKKITTVAALCLTTAVLVSTPASADPAKPANYPNRPINFVVSYPAGGGMDITARTLAAQMERVTGYQFRVENRSGGGSIVGNTYMATQARNDGYTVGILANPTVFVNILKQGAKFKKTDLEPIAGINFEPVVWTVRTDSQFGKMSFREIVDYAKANPEKVKVGVIPNSSFDTATRIVAKQTGASFTYVPFQGGKPAIVSLLGGNIDMSGIYYTEIAQYVQDGSLKVLAVADNSPLAEAPKAPTMKDLKIKMASGTWGADRFAAVPKGTDKAIKAYLSHLILKTLADPETHAAFEKVGVSVKAQGLAEKQKAYSEAYDEVYSYLKDAGQLKMAQ
ncbi:MAG: Bug family tripartite tricarboxylate transporter substrate binding protein [Rhodospirillaceae bacterium]